MGMKVAPRRSSRVLSFPFGAVQRPEEASRRWSHGAAAWRLYYLYGNLRVPWHHITFHLGAHVFRLMKPRQRSRAVSIATSAGGETWRKGSRHQDSGGSGVYNVAGGLRQYCLAIHSINACVVSLTVRPFSASVLPCTDGTG
ncbi:hypothetical protein MLD38_027871 [Melastoma candidum]|uniref:Uncharacterized protein n=1 Tax=Melastoma candidum TaxID=119954 RepID=A0ACB9N1H5_9MYRT|nr:hypothetical protein MLD38_027871 [Melastoma candidum]